MEKRLPGNPCCAEMTATDNFSLEFPPKATKEERALLLAAVILMDFSYFEEKPNK